MGTRPHRHDGPARLPSSEHAVIVEEVSRSFGSHQALADVSFDVRTGTVLGLLGSNGAGKTTLVNILSTILAPSGGRATVLGYDVATQPDDVRLVIGLAGQYAAVDDVLTARENLTMISRLSHLSARQSVQRANELLERFHLTDAADRQLRTFSGGMRRRIDLAAALVRRPPLVFLDEPTTGLDPRARLDLWEVVEELVHDGTTVVLTTQYLEEADRLADKIVVISAGTVVATGTPIELKQRIASTVVEFVFSDPATTAHAVSALGNGFEVLPHESPTVLALGGDGSPTAVREALDCLHRAGTVPLQIDVRRPSLDDVFLRLTNNHNQNLRGAA